jgi:hypothetical protein
VRPAAQVHPAVFGIARPVHRLQAATSLILGALNAKQARIC